MNLGYETLSHLTYSTVLSRTDYLFFKRLHQRHVKNRKLRNQGDVENNFLCFINSRISHFCKHGMSKLLQLCENVLIVMVLISNNKIVSKQNYDLS